MADVKGKMPAVSLPEERVRTLTQTLAKSGLAILDALEELERMESTIVEEVIKAEERKKISELKKQLEKKD